MPAAWSVSYRFFIASAAMFAYARWTGASLTLRGRDIALAAAAGVLQFVLNFNFVYAAEAYITSGLVAVVTVAQFASARPDSGTSGNGMALPAITIAILGGVAITGGVGRVGFHAEAAE